MTAVLLDSQPLRREIGVGAAEKVDVLEALHSLRHQEIPLRARDLLVEMTLRVKRMLPEDLRPSLPATAPRSLHRLLGTGGA